MAGWSEVDLHLHTTASDGSLSPAALVTLASQRGLRTIAVTDHDSTEGVEPALAAGRELGVEVLPGVEINTDLANGDVHVLGYLLDLHDAVLQRHLTARRESRFDRGRLMVEKLRHLGIDVTWKRVQQIAGAAEGGSVGRPHVAQALVEKSYVRSVQEAFEKYIGRDGPAYVERDKMTAEEATRVIRAAGGVPVLAHPGTFPDYAAALPALVDAGLAGLECYYGSYSPQEVAAHLARANEFDLVATGGSDFHGDSMVSFVAALGGTPVPYDVVPALKARHARLAAS